MPTALYSKVNKKNTPASTYLYCISAGFKYKRVTEILVGVQCLQINPTIRCIWRHTNKWSQLPMVISSLKIYNKPIT